MEQFSLDALNINWNDVFRREIRIILKLFERK